MNVVTWFDALVRMVVIESREAEAGDGDVVQYRLRIAARWMKGELKGVAGCGGCAQTVSMRSSPGPLGDPECVGCCARLWQNVWGCE